MNFFKNIVKGKEVGQDNIPTMKLGKDANNSWYDDKAKKWRFKGEEIKEEETTRSALPPKRLNPDLNKNEELKLTENNNPNNIINTNISKNTQQNSNLNDTNNTTDNNIKNNTGNENKGGLRSLNNEKKPIIDESKNNLQRMDPNSSVYVFIC